MCNTFQPENGLSINALKGFFYSLKTNKNPGYDDISSNTIKQCFGTLNRPLHYIYNIFLQSSVFPEQMKIARFISIFKGREVADLENCHPISILCCFFKFSKKLSLIVFPNIYLIIIYFIINNLDFKKIIQPITQLFK